MCFDTIYEEMKAKGLLAGSNESDLFVLDCDEAWRILDEWPTAKGISTRFQDALDTSESPRWLIDIPFAFEPWWWVSRGRITKERYQQLKAEAHAANPSKSEQK